MKKTILLSDKIFLYTAIAGMLLCIILNLNNHRFLSESNSLVQKIENKIGEEIKETNRQATIVMQAVNHPKIFSHLNPRINRSFFLFQNEKLIYWSDNKYMPEYYSMATSPNRSFLETDAGQFILIKYNMSDGIELFGLIRLNSFYTISNDYLYSGLNQRLFPYKDGLIIKNFDEKSNGVVSYLDKPIFSVVINMDQKVISQGKGNAILFTSFFFLGMLMYYIWRILGNKVKDGEFEVSFAMWVTCVLIIRYLMLAFEFPDNIIETGLFGSLFFASSKISPSLGDLLVNTIFVGLIFLFAFRFYIYSSLLKKILNANTTTQSVLSILIVFVCYLVLWYPHLLIQTIYENSQISQDITASLQFDFPRLITLIIYVVSGFTLFLCIHILFRVLFSLCKNNPWKFLSSLTIGTLFFLAFQLGNEQHYSVVIVTGATLFVILYFSQIFKNFLRWRYNSFLYVFIIVLLTSVSGAYGIYEFEKIREESNKEGFAGYFLVKKDNLTEYYLSEVSKRIEEDIFISSRIASPFLSKDVIIQKVRQVHLSSLFDKYEIKIGIYKDADEWLTGDSIPDVEMIMDDELMKPYRTEYDGIFFQNWNTDTATKRYLSRINIIRKEVQVGYLILDLQLKKVIPNDVYFELLVDNRFSPPNAEREYNYAVFTNGEITFSSGEFNYAGNFLNELLAVNNAENGKTIDLNGYTHYMMTDDEGRIIVVSAVTYSFWKIITNFSFLFLLQAVIILVIGLFIWFYNFYKGFNLNYSARIQLFFNLAFFIPLLLVSIVTLSLINSVFKEEVRSEYNEKAVNVAENISTVLDGYIHGTTNREVLLNRLIEVSKFTNSDVNLFNKFGELIATSQPLIYENKLLTRYVDSRAYSRMIENNYTEWVNIEKVGSLNYNANYIGLKSYHTGEFIGIMSIPYFDSEQHLERQQISIFSTIINIFTLLFSVFVAVSYFVSRGLTIPLRMITEKLKKTTLHRANEPLTWHSEDEIGLMVSEYNKMVKKMEENKRELAISQKETAWREIAQQVAHEIKNPLTPMKLTLQHLERKLENSDDPKNKLALQNLLRHIDTLSDIATSFSTFARMPIPEYLPFELIGTLRAAIGLHRNVKNLQIIEEIDENNIVVLGDHQLIGRIFSNIILNASQAAPSKKVMLKIILTVRDRKVVIEFQDNAGGIDEAIRSKIFVPNFTTKDTGSGIGLSIAKHGIEQSGGKIWFESETEVGTSFFIELRRNLV